jgi:hypothetical protein
MIRFADKRMLKLVRELRSHRHRLLTLAVFGWILLAQSLLVVHGIEHSNADGSATCALCAAAHHDAAMASVPQFTITHMRPEPLPVVPVVSRSVRVVPAYHSRAPPTI